MIFHEHLTRNCSLEEAFLPLVKLSITELNREKAEQYLDNLYQHVFDGFASIITIEQAKRTTFNNLNYYLNNYVDEETKCRVNEYYRCYR